ncbi:MAG: hypothetical protein AAFX07_03920 [Pseudomonadota bacterium]
MNKEKQTNLTETAFDNEAAKRDAYEHYMLCRERSPSHADARDAVIEPQSEAS